MRWLVLAFGLGIAAIAGWSLLSGIDAGGPTNAAARESQSASPHADSSHAEIDEASRDRLRAILREADRDGANSP